MGQDYFQGRLIQLSEKGADLQIAAADPLPAELTNLKLKLQASAAITEVSEDLYAKVVHQQPDRHAVRVYFTSVPPVLKHQLGALYRAVTSSDK